MYINGITLCKIHIAKTLFFSATVEHDPDLSLLLTSCLRFGHRRCSIEWDFIFRFRSMSFKNLLIQSFFWEIGGLFIYLLGRACVGMRFAGLGWSWV